MTGQEFAPPALPGNPAMAWSRRDLRVAVALALLCLMVYNANLRSVGTGDSMSARYLPFGIWRYGSLRMDPILDAAREGHPRPYWVIRGRGGHFYSFYPIVLPVVVAPLYLPAVGYLEIRGWTEQRLLRVAIVMEKLVSSLLAAIAVALMYGLLRRRAPPGNALLLTIAFAFGTDTWLIGSQALWQHGIAELLLIGVLLLITGACTAPRALAVGILCGLVCGNRPPDGVMAVALGLYGLFWAGRRAPWLAAGAAATLGLIVTYNVGAFGLLFGGYGTAIKEAFFQRGMLSGFAALLVSPSRGLLVFSPFLLLLPAALWHGLRGRRERRSGGEPIGHGEPSRRRERFLTLAIGVAFFAQLLFYAKTDWRAGRCWGPRWLTDILPLLIWLLPPALAALRRPGRLAFGMAVCAAVGIQVVGAFWYTGASDLAIGSSSHSPDTTAAWDPRNTPFVLELRHPPAPFDLSFTDMHGEFGAHGNIDHMTVDGRESQVVTAHSQLVLDGWALVNGRTPAALEITLDGQPLVVTTTFIDRPDVDTARDAKSPAGWRIVVPIGSTKPGPHRLAAAARPPNSVAGTPIAQRNLTVLPSRPESADLSADAHDAAALLRARQQRDGFWLTSYTQEPQFAAVQFEMNTTLTAVMIDLLTPIAAATGLEDTLAKARAHLADQIEDTGLVRNHGRPGAAVPPTLGCTITPDAADTALAWTFAGSAHPVSNLLPRALSTLQQYRTPQGLYRTWLAPTDAYTCVLTGTDPNPVDAVVQMQILLLLAQSDPPAAQALCTALRPVLAQPSLWGYYDKSPLLPVLLQPRLRQASCPLTLPPTLVAKPASRQSTWLAAATLYTRQGTANPPNPTNLHNLLHTLAQDDFALLRQHPPARNHTDLTSRFPLYHRSEDLGYALWLRLYTNAPTPAPPTPRPSRR
jgi:hypothetical protein